jgi:hypothetical protein
VPILSSAITIALFADDLAVLLSGDGTGGVVAHLRLGGLEVDRPRYHMEDLAHA